MPSLLALIDGSDNDSATLRAAAEMARAVEARLTVAHFKPAEAVPIGTFEMAAVLPNNSALVAEARRRAQEAYSEACSRLADCRLQVIDAGIAEAIEQLSPYHDLIVLERLSGVDGPDALAFSAALWTACCAILVTPAPAKSPESVRHVAVAWNGSLQAGRAVRAAMPFIQKAAQVTVLQRHGSVEDAELTRYLAAQDVPAPASRTYGQGHLSGRAWGRALLAATKEIGADLLVMGAYGSAVGNLLGFGRATEKIVTSAQVPVLLSA
jgi:nucleotide-binding universal stress UspA family protein